MNDSDSLKPILEALGSEYELVRELGKGTTSIVYLVRDTALERDVALKVIRSSFGHDEEALARLDREAKLVAKLHHPNIVKVYGTRKLADGNFVLLIEHVPGRNLKELIREEGPLPVSRAVGILRDVASALAYAHRRRIVHRDVKPENIYIDDEVGTARLADFGVARPWDRDTRLTLPGESLGTPAYMSPEQIDGQEVDGRTDVYSLGLVGYEILAGRHPWESDNLFSVIYKQKNEELPPLESIRPDVPSGLVGVLERACRKVAEDRWDSADVLLERLEAVDVRGMGAGGGAAGAGSTFDAAFDDDGPREWQPLDRPSVEAPPEVEVEEPAAGGPPTLEIEGPIPAPSEEAPEPTPPPPPAPPRSAAAEQAAAEARRHPPARPAPKRRRRWRPLAWVALLLVVGGAAAGGWYLTRGEGADAAPAPMAERTSVDDSTPPAEGLVESEDPADPTGEMGDIERAAILRVVDSAPTEGTVGETVEVAIRVEGPGGAPRADVPVAVRVAEGDAILRAARQLSGTDGLVRIPVRLPDVPGQTVLMARSDVPGADPGEVAARVVAVPGPPADARGIVGDGQQTFADSLLADPVGIVVRDVLGNPLPGLTVGFAVSQGGGRVAPARATTDSLGRAFARWWAGGTPGVQRVVATVESAPELRVGFDATAIAPTTPPPSEPETPEEEGDPAPTPPTVTAKGYAVGGTVVCRIGGGSPACRGSNDRGQRGGSGAGDLRALAPGVSHVCALDAEGEATCWGANDSGQLGDGTRTDRSIAVPVSGDVRFARLAAGLSHTCGIDGDGAVWCWGRNVAGQLGDGTRDDHAIPRPVDAPGPMSRLAAGWNHTCALDTAGRAWCWGLNGNGQLGDGSRLDRLTPSRVVGGSTFQEIAAGSAHSCGLAGGDVLCWGANGSGQLGDGTTTDAPRPVEAALPASAVRVAVGAVHSCALLVDGRVFCWGQNLHGQLGDGSREARLSPVPVAGDFRFRVLEAGGGVTCALSQTGDEYCWGLNQDGQLGDGSRTNRAIPTRAGG